MARDDEAVVEKLRLRVDGDDIADIKPSASRSARLLATTSGRSSTWVQATGWESISLLNVCPEAFSGRIDPRNAPCSAVKTVQRAPSANRDDQ